LNGSGHLRNLAPQDLAWVTRSFALEWEGVKAIGSRGGVSNAEGQRSGRRAGC